MADTETFSQSSRRRHKAENDDIDDFPTMTTDLAKNINWKVAIFLFALMFFIFSDMFTEVFLDAFDGAVEGDSPTTKGTMIQIIFTILSYICLDLLTKNNIL